MKNRRLLALFVCVSMAAYALTGCAGSDTAAETKDAEETAAEETTAEEPVEEEAEAEEPAAQSEPLAEAELQVFIAASLSGAMEEIAGMYNELQPNVKITYNADSSGTLQTQIEEGFACDLFFSAAEKQMDALVEGGYVPEESVVKLLENQVVLITPKDSGTEVTGFEDITKAANLALAGESVPVGNYSRQIFEKLGILEDVMAMEINECKNVSAVKEAVKEGSNEVGTVYYSDAYSVKDDVDIIAYSDDTMLDTPIIYPVALVNNPEATEAETAAAADFLAYLQTDEAKAVFENYMFLIYEE